MHKEEAKGCCKDEHKQVKLEQEQKITNIFHSELNFPIEIFVPSVDHYSFVYSSLVVVIPTSHAPPDKALTPVYLINCIFRI